MAASTELTTLAKVKRYLSLTDVNDNRDALLQTLIDATSESVENYCCREFAHRTRVEFHDGEAASCIILRCRPAASVISVHDDTQRKYIPASLLQKDDYVLYEKEGIIRRCGGCFADGLRNVRVEYVAGFDPVPPAVEQAANMLVAHFFARAQSGADAISSESVGVYSVSYDTGEWPQRVRGLLADFREIEL